MNNMKKTTITGFLSLTLLTMLLMLTSVSCKNESEEPIEIDYDNKVLALNDTNQILVNDYLYNSKYKLKLEYDSLIQDCRCPENVLCVWSGYASVQLKLTISDKAPLSFVLGTLSIHNSPQDTLIDGFRYKLIDCFPYPGTAATPDNSILVTVTKVE